MFDTAPLGTLDGRVLAMMVDIELSIAGAPVREMSPPVLEVGNSARRRTISVSPTISGTERPELSTRRRLIIPVVRRDWEKLRPANSRAAQ